ncbi:MAG: fimbrial protein [Parabacteroides gordonii]|nr:fimbrial protein [Parabacteroides gordonii]
MKTNNITSFLLALCLLASCSSGDDDGPEVIAPKDATLTLSVAPGSVLTKSAASGETQKGEAVIHTICVALFKEDGSLLASSYVDYGVPGETQKPDTIRVGAKSDTDYIYVILVNVGNRKFSTLDELKKATYALKDIKVDNQPMCSQFREVKLKPGANYIGSRDVFADASADANFCSTSPVNVYRTASRIDFEEIGIIWSDENATDLQKVNARFRLKRVYATQVKSHTFLTDRNLNDYSVELKEGFTYLHGREDSEGYLNTLNLFDPAEADDPVIIASGDYWRPEKINGKEPWRCYITENTEQQPVTLILKGDILPEDNDVPILKDRYFFVRLKEMEDSEKKKLPGVIRNYVIRISATISGKGSDDEIYRENAYATVTVTPEEWSVEEQHENVN